MAVWCFLPVQKVNLNLKIKLKIIYMKNENQSRDDQRGLQGNDKDKQAVKNPFKESSPPEKEETPQEDAAMEQQRKDALTERD
jgi:hypothetical protein